MFNGQFRLDMYCSWVQAPPLLWAPIDLIGLSIPRCCPSMIYVVFLCNDYHLLFPEVWFLAAYHDGRHGLTVIICDTLQLIVRAPDVQRGCWPVAKHFRLFYALCMICQVSLCSTCFQISSQRQALTAIDQYWLTSDLLNLNFVGKLMELFFQSTASLVMAECACARLIFLGLCRFQVHELVHFFYYFSIIHMFVGGVGLMLLKRMLLLSELNSIPHQVAVPPAFQGIAAVLLHCLQLDQHRQQTASYKTVVLQLA